MTEFQRKNNRLPPQAYHGRRAYFLTLCTREREKSFQDPLLVNALLDILRTTCSYHSFLIYAYCFMPDHLHLILVGEKESCQLSSLAKAFKGAATSVARSMGITRLWQKGFYDHVLRSAESWDAAASYVLMNPVRAGLVRRSEDWPYSGSFVVKCPPPV